MFVTRGNKPRSRYTENVLSLCKENNRGQYFYKGTVFTGAETPS